MKIKEVKLFNKTIVLLQIGLSHYVLGVKE